MAVSKPLLSEFGNHHKLESCAKLLSANFRVLIHTDVEALVGVRKFSRVETGMGVTFRP